MEKTIRCLECGKSAELRHENRIIRKGNKTFKIKGIPYYNCLTCGEPTYDFYVELRVEEITDNLHENNITERMSCDNNFIANVMDEAIYKILDDGSYYGEILKCTGVWANEQTLEKCRQVLQEVLEEWINIQWEEIKDD
ncbi:MAG TPA: hypothetical protein DHV24_11340 [Candidatus Margulisbacteria bacterium]|nr:hypothetical protein [Candidatus Margulisiibacteriota bacterium]